MAQRVSHCILCETAQRCTVCICYAYKMNYVCSNWGCPGTGTHHIHSPKMPNVVPHTNSPIDNDIIFHYLLFICHGAAFDDAVTLQLMTNGGGAAKQQAMAVQQRRQHTCRKYLITIMHGAPGTLPWYCPMFRINWHQLHFGKILFVHIYSSILVSVWWLVLLRSY